MDTLTDDVGSFPLPLSMDKKLFEKAYVESKRAIINGSDIRKDEFLSKNFCRTVLDSFLKKCMTGLDIVNYPQHFDGVQQFTDAITERMSKGTYLVDQRDAVMPEVWLIEREGKKLSENIGKRISLRVCITGPMELYLKLIGAVAYEDVMLMFAETTRRFAKNSLLNSKYVKTEMVSMDEPSFGFQEINAENETRLKMMERCFDFGDTLKQIHLHSPSKISDVLNVRNLDILSFEYAGSPKNMESVSKRMLEKAGKQIRIGVSRTDIDAIMAELRDRGKTEPTSAEIVEDEKTIRKRFENAKEKYGELMTFTGPDCGLGGWPTQEAAQLLLTRTVKAVKETRPSI